VRKDSGYTITDQFCGAGGSSQGARRAVEKHGGRIAVALNHWKLAIETHNTNFPEAIHDCTDIQACDPRRYPSTNLLITAPECTNHTPAKGKKAVKGQLDLFEKGILDPTAERSRATMWDVPRFAEVHNYEHIIVENVVEAIKWVYFPAWIMAMDLKGYRHEIVFRNSMHFHPTPQSRDRMYVVFWKKGNPAPDLDYRPLAFCPDCGKDVEAFQSWKNPAKRHGKYKTQYIYACPTHYREVEPYYYAAYNVIDWSDPGKRIGDRKKPLADNTLKRIQYGLDKYGKEPILINDQHSTGIECRIRGMHESIQTVNTTPHFKLFSPFQVVNYSPGYSKSIQDPTGTITGGDHHAICTPFIFKEEHSQNLKNAKSVDSPFATQTTRQSMAMVVPFIIEMNRSGKAKPASEPTGTITAGGINHAALGVPLMVNNKGKSMSMPSTDAMSSQTGIPHMGICTSQDFKTFISYYYGKSQASHITDALGTCRTTDSYQMINFQEPKIEDCFYRMLYPREIKLAMAFEEDYVILGSGKEQVKQCGNAVTPPVMEWLVQRCLDTLK
jgi:DNA (cytosine-5)-methyltransferase 1